MQALTDLFEESVRKYTDNVYLWEKKTDKYEPTTYIQVQAQVYKFAAGLMNLGVAKGDRIALLSEGCNNWIIAELGILYAGAISIPLSVKLTEPLDISFRLEHSGARMIIVSQYQAKKIANLKDQLPSLEKIILFGSKEKYENKVIFYDEILMLGEEYLKKHNDEFTKRWQSVKPSDYATICYTSGTTADPKGIILSHRNYTANAEQALSLHTVPEYFKTLMILPLDHSFAHTVCIYTIMKNGSSIASVQVGKTSMETLKNIPVNIKEIKPHFLLSVPALAKSFRKNIETGVYNKGKVLKSLFGLGLKTAYIYNGNGLNKGKGLRLMLKPIYELFDLVIFKKIRESFGGHMRFFVGGGALLDIELQRFFCALGMPMYQGYGLTEASPIISTNAERKFKLGSSGPAVACMDLKICDEQGREMPLGQKGEIVIRGENVMVGYWKNDEATKKTIIDGWLHTGDMGYLDKDGFLYVLGRFKSLLIGDDGEKFSPEGIEEAFVGQSAFIDQCMLYNNQNPYTITLLVPNKEAIKRWLKEKHLEINSAEAHLAALRLIEKEINEYKKGKKFENMFPQRWLPAAIAVIDEAFTEDNQLLNSTLKLVRGKVVEKYKQRINYLYTPEAKDICNKQNLGAISKLLMS